MTVKEIIERLQTLDPNFEVYITNAEETQLTGIDVVIPCEDFGKDDREEFVAIFPKETPQPLFTLSPEEVEDLRFILDKRNSRLDFMLEKAFEDTPINRERIKEQKRLLPILNRITQWQNETAANKGTE